MPFTVAFEGLKLRISLASFTITLFAPVSTRKGMLSVSATKQNGSHFKFAGAESFVEAGALSRAPADERLETMVPINWCCRCRSADVAPDTSA